MRPQLFSIALLPLSLLVPGLAQAQTLPAMDWSGAYLGAGLGGVVDIANTSGQGSDNGQPAYFNATDLAQLRSALAAQNSTTRLAGQVFAGFGQQTGQLYYGLEASMGTASLEGSRTTSQDYDSLPGTSFTNTLAYSAHWQAALRARLGIARDNWLAYVSGGLAATQFHLDATFSDTNGATPGRGSSSSDPLVLGATLGLGAEYALDEHWSVRADYAFTHFGEASTTMAIVYPGFSSDLRNGVQLSSHTVTAGLSYRF